MTIHVALHHCTRYTYDRRVGLGPQIVRLRPAPHCRTPIISYSLKVQPAQHFINWQQDPQSNYLARLVFPGKTEAFTLDVDLVAELAVIDPFDFFLAPEAENTPFEYDPGLDRELAPFRERLPATPRFSAWLQSISREKQRTVDFLVAINRRVQREIAYIIRLEAGVQTPEQTLTLGSGSCRDTAWLLVQLLRHLGFAARFVSGYLIQLAPDVRPLDGPPGPPADFTDLHAWAEVYLPGAGWVGLDPTSGLWAGEGHIPLAATPDPGSAAPIEGTVDDCEVAFSHEMKVDRVWEPPRTTKPYDVATWHRIEALGHGVDARLVASDVRLTMGGEPTFVSIDDMEGEEWTIGALGPAKRLLAGRLLRRLAGRFGAGPLLHYGQGKWYPGEPLPRWALGCWWRKDGEPIWRDPELFADESKTSAVGAETAARFAQRLAERLGVDPARVLSAYEDYFYYLWREQRMPVNVTPSDSKLRDPEERARLARLFGRGLDAPVGSVLPLYKGPEGWVSSRWLLRDEHLRLTPGDSPMGLRLPLDSLPWSEEGDDLKVWEEDPFAIRAPLPRNFPQPFQVRSALRAQRHDFEPVSQNAEPASARLAASISSNAMAHTALCVEPRNGLLYVFMPPLPLAEDYLEALAAIEATAGELRQPVLIEGYPPPDDPRLRHFSVTPDPGVIEVNIHPAQSWDELVANTTTLYEEARLARLGTEKFMLDGRHAGTGGGNHLTLGGAKADDSPLLRRPDLLKSLLGYWHNHPSLSYLFSGIFIGPTSQHPRVDEARNEAVYDLEIALSQIPPPGNAVSPWLVDRILRNVLVDLTGNTHRAEFCIDKLYAPETSAGRLGLLELRAFEMPPHPQMSLTQQLLVRALVAWFWEHPYEHTLVRWRTRLHDQFMLPHFVREDFANVVADLNAAGFPFDAAWFDPHHEFRFPRLGDVAYRGIKIELRTALEPWNVLGEEPGAGRTARYVDSSVERLQVKVNNLVEPRHVVTCNGRPLPLHPTGSEGEYVCGVRFRAWRPAACLHPTIGVHAPLVFDLVDTWAGRSIGGCTYHVAHPGGRHFETFPVNALAAESRRRARFFRSGHTPGELSVAAEPINPEFPMTLDLRYLPGG